jgi:hypothetical protein
VEHPRRKNPQEITHLFKAISNTHRFSKSLYLRQEITFAAPKIGFERI